MNLELKKKYNENRRRKYRNDPVYRDKEKARKITDYTPLVQESAGTPTVRRLLPIECERLMGFPDNWTKIPYRGKSEEDCPDSPRYKACGNSMCVNVMRWIGKRIDTITKGETK